MSDEEESMSEGFSASEDEWKPSKDLKGGESSDDDDSDFEGLPLTGAASCGNGTSVGRKKEEPKARSAVKQISKKRSGLSLRTKLYNKYRPPPKTISPSGSIASKNSPTASTSRTNSKNFALPNESKGNKCKANDGEESGSSSDSSIGNYLVNFQDLDIQSSFFNVAENSSKKSTASPAPVFDCNAGLGNLSESASDGERDQANRDGKGYDFNNLLEYAKSMERFKESVAKHTAEEAKKESSATKNIDTLDVYSVLALGEKQHNRSHNDGEDEDDEDDEGHSNETRPGKNQPGKLSKTKSTRIKRHTKTRPSSTIAANDSDDSDWEEVADSKCANNSAVTSSDISQIGNLEIHVELPSRHREKKTKSQEEIEMAFKRKLNRDIRDRQILLHKSSLLCRFARTIFYNRLLNNTILMQKALKLLPSKFAYPPETGTEIKYFQSMVTWFKSAVKLKDQNLYPENSGSKTKAKALAELLRQIEVKEARCKQDMVFIFVILLRSMGLQCRLIENMQPLPLRPAQSDLLSIKLKKEDESKDKSVKQNEPYLNSKTETEMKAPFNKNSAKEKPSTKENKNEVEQKNTKNQKPSAKTRSLVDNVKGNAKPILETQSSKVQEKRMVIKKQNLETKTKFDNDHNGNEERKKKEPATKNAIQTRNRTKNSGEETHPSSSNTDLTKLKTLKPSCSSSLRPSDEPLIKLQPIEMEINGSSEEVGNSQNENAKLVQNKPSLARLKRAKPTQNNERPNKLPVVETQSVDVPKVVVPSGKKATQHPPSSSSALTRVTRSRSKSPHAYLSTAFLTQGANYKEKFLGVVPQDVTCGKKETLRAKSPANKVKISTDFLKNTKRAEDQKRVLRSNQKTTEATAKNPKDIVIPQLDGSNDVDKGDDVNTKKDLKPKNNRNKNPNLGKLKSRSLENSDEDFEPSPPKKPKVAPALLKKNRRVVSSEEDENGQLDNAESTKQKPTAGDLWVEVWCDVEEQWICVDIFKGKLHCVDTIKKSASSSLAYVFAFQNDLSIKDVTARYCPNWATVIRKSRVEKPWLDAAISKYFGNRTKRDIKEDEELRRIHEEKPMPTAISEYKNHPFYVLERHLLKFEALYPPDAPTLGFIRGEAVYSRSCVQTLHSREIWLKQARTVKLGEKPYKIVKARPKWDRVTQTVIKDQPLEIFGFWQTQDYEPPTAENGLVPRNAYGNVELFKPTMLPKKTKHIKLPGLNRICKKLGIDCANAVVGFDFHQGACHPTYDGFVVCEEFADQVVAAWYQDQEEQERKAQEKYETRVYGNWKKLIRGLLIRERLKLKYNL